MAFYCPLGTRKFSRNSLLAKFVLVKMGGYWPRAINTEKKNSANILWYTENGWTLIFKSIFVYILKDLPIF